jgi:hypothetical protein
VSTIDHRVRRGSRGTRYGPMLGGLAVGLALGFVLGALVEILLLGDGWRTTFEDGVYPVSFVVALAGVLLGGFLLLSAEREGDRARAWRAAGVFVASSVLAALLFWAAL